METPNGRRGHGGAEHVSCDSGDGAIDLPRVRRHAGEEVVEYRPEAEHIAQIVGRVSGEPLGTRILARFRPDWKRNSCLSGRPVELESDEFDLSLPVTRFG